MTLLASELTIFDWDALVALHCEALPGSLITGIGEYYVRTFYEYVLWSPLEGIFIEQHDGHLVGMAVVTLSPETLPRRLLMQTPLIRAIIYTFNLRVAIRLASGLFAQKQTGFEIPHIPEVLLLAVNESFRNKGIGCCLLRAAEKWLIDKGHEYYYVKTLSAYDNRATSFYLREGFREIGETVHHGLLYTFFTRKINTMAGKPMIKSTKLNLGCGYFRKTGYINVDIDPKTGANIIHDLSVFPYPFDTESFDLIEMDHILEHLENIQEVIREIDRLLRPGGKLIIRVPHFSRGFTHWDHRRGFDVTFPYYFSSDISGGFADINLKHLSTRLTWFAQKSLKKRFLSKPAYFIGLILGYLFDFLGNINLFFTSRLLCYWVGGYDEVEFVFTKGIPSKAE
ncbi:hypothetical protein CCP4SC76_600032 [Gammaproteobacteria bacterium]